MINIGNIGKELRSPELITSLLAIWAASTAPGRHHSPVLRQQHLHRQDIKDIPCKIPLPGIPHIGRSHLQASFPEFLGCCLRISRLASITPPVRPLVRMVAADRMDCGHTGPDLQRRKLSLPALTISLREWKHTASAGKKKEHGPSPISEPYFCPVTG